MIGDTGAVEIGAQVMRVYRGSVPGGAWEIDLRSGDVPLRLVLDDTSAQSLLVALLECFSEVPFPKRSQRLIALLNGEGGV